MESLIEWASGVDRKLQRLTELLLEVGGRIDALEARIKALEIPHPSPLPVPSAPIPLSLQAEVRLAFLERTLRERFGVVFPAR